MCEKLFKLKKYLKKKSKGWRKWGWPFYIYIITVPFYVIFLNSFTSKKNNYIINKKNKKNKIYISDLALISYKAIKNINNVFKKIKLFNTNLARVRLTFFAIQKNK